MLVARYPTKKALKEANLKEAKGESLRHEETSMFGPEYRTDGRLTVVGPGAYQRKWYAQVTMQDGLISKVT
jgi:hypothetical protein